MHIDLSKIRRFPHKIHELLIDPEFTTSFHKYATFTWILLVIPSFLWWKESIAWVVFMSVWANVAGHWSSYQASRVERKQDEAASDTPSTGDGGSGSDCSADGCGGE